MANETTKNIVDAFKQLCEDHNGVNYFDFSKDGQYLFNNGREEKYPLVFLQLLDETVSGNNVTRSFGLYSMDETSPAYDFTKDGDYDYNEDLLQLEDQTLTVCRDLIGRFKEENSQNYIITPTAGVFQNNAGQGVIGWRQDFTVETIYVYDDNNFPE